MNHFIKAIFLPTLLASTAVYASEFSQGDLGEQTDPRNLFLACDLPTLVANKAGMKAAQMTVDVLEKFVPGTQFLLDAANFSQVAVEEGSAAYYIGEGVKSAISYVPGGNYVVEGAKYITPKESDSLTGAVVKVVFGGFADVRVNRGYAAATGDTVVATLNLCPGLKYFTEATKNMAQHINPDANSLTEAGLRWFLAAPSPLVLVEAPGIAAYAAVKITPAD